MCPYTCRLRINLCSDLIKRTNEYNGKVRGRIKHEVFHDWIEVTKKMRREKSIVPTIHHVVYTLHEQLATTPPIFIVKEEIQRSQRFSTVKRWVRGWGDLERRWIEGRGDASSARPRFNSSLENIFHGVMWFTASVNLSVSETEKRVALMSTCFICCPTPKPARVCTFSSRINPDGRNSNENRRRSPLLSLRTYKFPLYPFPTLPSLFIFLFPFLLFPLPLFLPFFFSFNLSVTSKYEGTSRFRGWRRHERRTSRRIWPRPVPFEIQMDDGRTRKEKTGDTPSPTLSSLRIICINKFRRERIQRGGSVSQFQLCRAVSFDPPLFALLRPCTQPRHIMISGLLR